jgi:predicted nucleic acid-binding protein
MERYKSMKQKVYVETSIFSYLTSKPSRNILAAAWQSLTAEWWERRRLDFDLFISELVREEATGGDKQAAARRIAAMDGIPLLKITDEVVSLGRTLLEPGPLPQKATGDALHLSLASIHKMDYLLTWNCRHLDNAEIKPKVRRLLAQKGLSIPEICTPQELIGDKNNEE